MDINDIFVEEISKIDATLVPKNFVGDVSETRAAQEQVAKIIDQLGEESATAQGLNKVITSAEKLRKNPTHVVYLLKDCRCEDATGAIIGMLKVGRKHLFLFDEKERVHEVEPLCVLDFYVVRDRQRMGFGRAMFDYMLNDLEVMPWEMAIDGPSAKMESFLSRNFGIDKLFRQNNNFAIAPGFFERTDHQISNTGGLLLANVSPTVGRFAAPRPPSAIANVIHGAGEHEEAARRSPPGAAPFDERRPHGEAGGPRDTCHADYEAVWAGECLDDRSDPELDDDAYEDFDPDQPAMERRDEIRARGPYRFSPPGTGRPASLGVQRDEDTAASAPPDAPAGQDAPAAGTPSGGARRDSQLTERGYFDVKYYHNKLW